MTTSSAPSPTDESPSAASVLPSSSTTTTTTTTITTVSLGRSITKAEINELEKRSQMVKEILGMEGSMTKEEKEAFKEWNWKGKQAKKVFVATVEEDNATTMKATATEALQALEDQKLLDANWCGSTDPDEIIAFGAQRIEEHQVEVAAFLAEKRDYLKGVMERVEKAGEVQRGHMEWKKGEVSVEKEKEGEQKDKEEIDV